MKKKLRLLHSGQPQAISPKSQVFMNSDSNMNGRPKRAALPLARLRDTENTATPELQSHQQAQTAVQEQLNLPAPPALPAPQTNPDNVDYGSPPPVSLGSGSHKCKHTGIDLNLSDQNNEDREQPNRPSRPAEGEITI